MSRSVVVLALILAAGCGSPVLHRAPGTDNVKPRRQPWLPDSTRRECTKTKVTTSCGSVARDTFPDPSRGIGEPVKKTP